MRRYLLRKIVQAVLTILAILVLNFGLFRILPGDPVRTFLPRGIPAKQEAQVRAQLGLDQPIFPNQFITYVKATVQGDFGYSFVYKQPVTTLVGSRLGPTALLVGVASILSIILGLLLGAVAGARRGSWFDTFTISSSMVLYAMPVFWLGMIGIMIFGAVGFPINGMQTPGVTYSGPLSQAADVAAHLFMPALVLALALIGQYALLMRSSLTDVMAEDYIETARAKGLREEQVVTRHAIPNALLPTVTLIGINLGYIWTGAITLEDVFGWPGLGSLIVDSVSGRDYPVLQAAFLLITITVVTANLLADLVYGLLDPRVAAA